MGRMLARATVALLLARSFAAAEPAAAPSSPAPPPPPAAPAQAGATSLETEAAPPAPPAATPLTPSARLKVAQGDRFAASGDDRAALFAYQDAVNLAPQSPEARLRLGASYQKLDHLAQAVEQWQIAAELDPSSEEARRLLERGKAALASGGGPSAALPRSPKGAPAPAAQAEPAPPASTSAADLYERAVKLVAEQKFVEAIRVLDQAIRVDPRLAVARAARGSARFGLGRYREAIEDYEAALALDASLATPLYGLGECYRVLEDPSAAGYYARYAASTSSDVREELRSEAKLRAAEARRH